MSRLVLCAILLLFLGDGALDAQTFDLRSISAGTSNSLLSARVSSQDDSGEDDDDAPPPWYERLRFSGDFRSRYEGFYQDKADPRQKNQ